MNYEQALSYIRSLGHETLNIKLGLTTTQMLLSALGHPERNYLIVQIVGTNGKGSIGRLIESICVRAGIRCGLFSSPHLISITERIRIDGRPLSEDRFAGLTQSVRNAASELLKRNQIDALPSVFEHVTAIALLAFQQALTDVVFIEAGLGGRLDATTAVGARLIVVSSISLDHQDYLGNSIAEIASEKAAIIGPETTAVIAPQTPDALTTILKQCEATRAKARFVQVDRRNSRTPAANRQRSDTARIIAKSRDGRFCFDIQTEQDMYGPVWIGLRGHHQIGNAAAAIVMAEVLRTHGFSITRDAVMLGVENVSHEGRLELWQGPPRILFDGAHNLAAVEALGQFLDEFIPQPITIVFGAMRDKRLREMAAMLFPLASTLIVTRVEDSRAASIHELMETMGDQIYPEKVFWAHTVAKALQIAIDKTPTHGTVCVTGSLHLVGAAQEILKHQFTVEASLEIQTHG